MGQRVRSAPPAQLPLGVVSVMVEHRITGHLTVFSEGETLVPCRLLPDGLLLISTLLQRGAVIPLVSEECRVASIVTLRALMWWSVIVFPLMLVSLDKSTKCECKKSEKDVYVLCIIICKPCRFWAIWQKHTCKLYLLRICSFINPYNFSFLSLSHKQTNYVFSSAAHSVTQTHLESRP